MPWFGTEARRLCTFSDYQAKCLNDVGTQKTALDSNFLWFGNSSCRGFTAEWNNIIDSFPRLERPCPNSRVRRRVEEIFLQYMQRRVPECNTFGKKSQVPLLLSLMELMHGHGSNLPHKKWGDGGLAYSFMNHEHLKRATRPCSTYGIRIHNCAHFLIPHFPGG